jgi:hypothetical protein
VTRRGERSRHYPPARPVKGETFEVRRDKVRERIDQDGERIRRWVWIMLPIALVGSALTVIGIATALALWAYAVWGPQ